MNTKILSFLMVLALLVVGFAAPVHAVAPDTEVKIDGVIKATYLGEDGTGWIKVDGIKVVIDENTMIDGMLKVGAEVEIDGNLLGLLADEIEILDEPVDLDVAGDEGGVKVEGTITKPVMPVMKEGMEGHKFFKVDGIKVVIGPDTDFDDGMLDDLVVGVGVEVEGTHFKILATDIEVENHSVLPIPGA